MAVFRVEKTKDFTIMSNHHLRNTELSLKAKGLLSLMLSLPEDWDYTTKGLAHICKDGVDSITTALKELERHGYLTRQRLRYDNGQLGDIEYKPLNTLPDSRFLGKAGKKLFPYYKYRFYQKGGCSCRKNSNNERFLFLYRQQNCQGGYCVRLLLRYSKRWNRNAQCQKSGATA